ncbi:hypothetical protein [Mycolicibacterium parafortuitum]|nr:hypothetical protein [Mycolicibacterium parafortuitum]ORB27820.1 hypothetical protein BST38_22960 [Mycolicibacterium parafortuitum]PQE00419.1 hypothetical protein CYL16_12445 [Mycobacterium sp. EPG1]BBY73112.1 hypothetical protein MPRF_00110 [Mycolicibacterium parafortuitum]
MKNITIATTAAAAFAAGLFGLAAPAAAAPTGGDAQDTIAALEAEGHRVIVHRLSDTPLSQATVVGVNPGADIRSTVQDYANNRTYQNTVTGKIYYVNVR